MDSFLYRCKRNFPRVASEATTSLTLFHSERPKLYAILAFLSAIGLNAYDSVFISFKVKSFSIRVNLLVELCNVLGCLFSHFFSQFSKRCFPGGSSDLTHKCILMTPNLSVRPLFKF